MPSIVKLALLQIGEWRKAVWGRQKWASTLPALDGKRASHHRSTPRCGLCIATRVLMAWATGWRAFYQVGPSYLYPMLLPVVRYRHTDHVRPSYPMLLPVVRYRHTDHRPPSPTSLTANSVPPRMLDATWI